MKILLSFLLFAFYQIDISENITLRFKGETIGSVHRAEFVLPPFEDSMINEDKFIQLREMIEKKVYEKPLDASIDERGNMVTERTGHKLNRIKFTEMFYTYYFKKGSASFDIPIQNIYPRVDSEMLTSLRVKRIGNYVTYFNSHNEERSHNIFLAANAINGHIIFPGETFSFNKVVGKRTIAKGYLPAPIIVKGELSEGIGGGICQVSSTLFNAVDRAGVQITERYSHSRRVPYVPPNRDATVSWYGPDFKFKNPHNQPLLIRAKVVGGQLFIMILSSEDIDFKPREVPSAPKKLPIEVNTNEGKGNTN
jgi:vancomycin resistance protein YoaR